MNDIVNIETIPTAIIGNLSRKEIKDKAADMVVGLDSDDIKSYNPESSRKNRILNRVYNRYNKKYNDEKFANLSLREINKLPTKEQERWFALNKNKTAGPVLGGVMALTAPMMLGPLVEAPTLTLASLAGSTIGGKTGQYVGEAFDRNNHGYTNYSDVFTMLGGAVGGLSPIAINKGLNNIVTTWNSGKQHKSDYSNWGGEFINDLPMSKRFQTTRGPIDSSLHPNISRSQRELWTMQDLYGAALKTGDRKLIGDTADALNRQHRKYITETGHAKLTDAELVDQFNNLRAIASHNRQNGNDYLTYTRKALKLVPELNRRGITKSYFPTHDDLTYTLVTDAERYKYLADKFGGTAMKNAADNNISAYDYNISQSRKFRKLFDSEFGGYMRPMGIGNRTYSGINLSNKTIVSNKPSKTAFYNTGSQMQNAKQAIYNGGMDMYRFMESDAYKNSVLHDTALAKRAFNIDINPVQNGSYVTYPVQVNNNRIRDGYGTTAILETDNPSQDVITLDVGQHRDLDHLQNTAFHEYGHHGRYKVVDPVQYNINGRPDPSVEPTSNFYKWKLKHLFKPEVEIPAHLKDHYAYLTDVNPYFNEGATNVLEIGYAGGFTPTTGYPGEMQLRTMLDDVLLANPEYKYTIDLLDMRKPKRVWEALIGNYENGGKLDSDYVDKIKGFLKRRTMSPKEYSYINNFTIESI